MTETNTLREGARGLDRAPFKQGISRYVGASHARIVDEDAVFVTRLLAGDKAAFTALVRRYHSRLIRLAMSFVACRAAAEEVVQDTWIGVLNGLASFERRSQLKAWIFQILTNRAKTRGVREARSVPVGELRSCESWEPGGSGDSAREVKSSPVNGSWTAAPRLSECESPEQQLLRQSAFARLHQELGKLPANQRAVLLLRNVEGLDSDEVCRRLEITETNQRVLIYRARSALRRALDDAGECY